SDFWSAGSTIGSVNWHGVPGGVECSSIRALPSDCTRTIFRLIFQARRIPAVATSGVTYVLASIVSVVTLCDSALICSDARYRSSTPATKWRKSGGCCASEVHGKKRAHSGRASRQLRTDVLIAYRPSSVSRRRSQRAIEEIAGGMVGAQPGAMQQEIVNFIREDELFDMDIALTQARDQVNGLCEIHVAVVIAVDEQYWRFPLVDRSDGRR